MSHVSSGHIFVSVGGVYRTVKTHPLSPSQLNVCNTNRRVLSPSPLGPTAVMTALKFVDRRELQRASLHSIVPVWFAISGTAITILGVL